MTPSNPRLEALRVAIESWAFGAQFSSKLETLIALGDSLALAASQYVDDAERDRERLDTMEHNLAFAQRLRSGWHYELMDGEVANGDTLRSAIDLARGAKNG